MMTDNAHILPAGTRLNGKYTIERYLGQGGFGIGYKARRTDTGGYCAIKEFFLNRFCFRDSAQPTVYTKGLKYGVFEAYRKKFYEEGQLLQRFNHPNIVKVMDAFSENNTAYIVMQFIKGETLHRKVKASGRMKHAEAVNMMGQLANAVDCIHRQNFLHRDIKPGNIMVTPDHRAILIDFGAAREYEPDTAQQRQHTIMYSEGYAPLEQYLAESGKGVWSDIYSMGATFYFAVTGETPMAAPTRKIENMNEPLKLVRDMPQTVNRTIMKAMQMEPKDRYQSVQEFMDDLLNRQRPVKPDPPAPPATPVKKPTTPPLQKTNPKTVTFGRGEANIARIDDRKVSRIHARITRCENGAFRIADLNSRNGTFVNGRRITGETEIKSDDKIQIGDTHLQWRKHFPDEPPPPTGSDEKKPNGCLTAPLWIAGIVLIIICHFFINHYSLIF